MLSTRAAAGLSSLVFVAFCVTTPTLAQQKRKSGNEQMKLSAVANQEIELRSALSLDRNCDSYDMPRIAIIRAPKNGTVTEEFRERYSNFGPNNPRKICNDKKSKATYALYRATSGFQGVDRFTFAIVYYDGKTDVYDVEMTVWR
ncbi:MAG: hypothetical protein J0L51_01290 [Rhizobiales bacterium]|nr:hypothetical protein [Hyphomicrobiales bacterium]